MAKFATFGDVTFEVSENRVYTFDDFTRSGSSRWTLHEVRSDKPLPEFVGPGQDEITFLIKLSAMQFVHPAVELHRLREFRDQGKVASFIIGGKPISNSYWYIESLIEKNKTRDGQGRLIIAEAELTLKEYPRPPAPVTAEKPKPKPVSPVAKTQNASKVQHIGIVTVKASSLNIRSGASLNAKVVKVSKKNQSWKVYGTKTTDITWYDVGAGLYLSASPTYVSFKKV